MEDELVGDQACLLNSATLMRWESGSPSSAILEGKLARVANAVSNTVSAKSMGFEYSIFRNIGRSTWISSGFDIKS